MPDFFRDILTVINTLFALAVVGLSIIDYRQERRQGYLWVWLLLCLVGTVWSIIYIPGVLEFFGMGHSTRNLMGTGVIRSAVTLTLGSIIAIRMLLRIPRKP